MRRKIVFLLTLLSIGLAAGADGLNGPEFTFSNPSLIACARNGKIDEFSHQVSRKLHKLYLTMQSRCKDCLFSDFIQNPSGFSKFKVTLPTGKTLFIHADDWVVEAGMTPVTLSEIKTNQSLVDDLLFKTAREIGLFPQPRIGGGHQHLDLETYFHGDAVLFRNFLVDLMNRPELFLGGLSLDLLNAPPLAILTAKQIAQFSALIDRFDRKPVPISKLMTQINEQVYGKTYIQYRAKDREIEAFMANQRKYQAINLLHAGTLEIRGLTPPKSFMDFYFRSLLFSSRIDQLKKLGNKRLAFHPKNLRALVGWTVSRRVETYTVGLPQKEITQALRDYIKAAGLNVTQLMPYLHTEVDCSAWLDPSAPH